MQKCLRFSKTAWFSAALLAVVCLPMSAVAQSTVLNRLSAEFKYFDGVNIAQTTATPPGMLVYSKSVFVPSAPIDQNVMYVTISATGVNQGPNAAAWFRCEIDGAPCNPGITPVAGAPAGWIALLREPSILPDNAVNYTWCMKQPSGTHTVQIRMASSQAGAVVAIEGAHFYIDSNRITTATGGCTQGQ